MIDTRFSEAILFLKGIARQPYDFVHPLETVDVALKYLGYIPADKTKNVLMACVLHDVLEDFAVHYADLADNFGRDVADLVYDVTDELGKNRSERKTRTTPKILGNRLACFVKFCDRYANVQHGLMNDKKSKMGMYRKEYSEFRETFFDSLPVQMWDDMDGLMRGVKC